MLTSNQTAGALSRTGRLVMAVALAAILSTATFIVAGDRAEAARPAERGVVAGYDFPAAALTPGQGVLLVSDEPLTDEDRLARPTAADCSAWYEICGIVYNRSGRTLELRRDSTSHTSCSPANPDLRRYLASGQDSNKIGSPTWPDVDCFRHNTSGCTRFYRGVFWSPGSWIRIYNSVWVYNLNC